MPNLSGQQKKKGQVGHIARRSAPLPAACNKCRAAAKWTLSPRCRYDERQGPTEGQSVRKPILFLVVLGLAVLATVLVAEPDLTALRGWLVQAESLRAAHPLALAAGFFALYVAVTAVSLPFAVCLTLLGGALFGFWAALLLVSFAASVGATLAFLVARYLARDWVHGRLGPRAARIEAGLARDGAFYLFSLRLIPVVPFFAVNLAFGLTPMRAATFYAVSQLGMVPGTAAYVFAGTQLAQIDSLSGILSPGVVAALVTLGLLPWIARGVLRLIAGARRRARWPRPARFDRNLVVIGAGAAGLVASYVAAAARARVTLIAEGPMGGDCLNTGCVPSKALIASGKAAAAARGAHRLGVCAAPQVDFPAVMARLRGVIESIAPNDSEARYRSLGVEVIRGHARLVDPWTVEVNGTRLTTRAVVLATGAAPVIPPIPGIEAAHPLTSETLWDHLAGLDTPPENLLVLGGGPIGCELAQALVRLGAGVTLLESGPRLLPREEPEAGDLVAASLRADGVRLLLDSRVDRFEGVQAVLEDGTRLGFGTLLVATGRQARLQDLGLEELGIPADRVIETGAYLETLHPNIFAAGDLAGPAQLTNAAGHQGWIAAANALAAPFWRFRAAAAPIPAAVFTSPEVARVGLTVAEAAARGLTVEITRYPLADLDRAITEGATTGFVQILTAPGRDRIVGATVVGAQAGEIVAEFALAMRHGLGLGKILSTPHIYPSWSEAAKNAAGRWKQARVSPRLLAWAERFHGWRRG